MCECTLSKESLINLKEMYGIQNKTKEMNALLNLFKNEMKMNNGCKYVRREKMIVECNYKNENLSKEFKERILPMEYHHMVVRINDKNEKEFYTEKGERILINVNINFLRDEIFEGHYFESGKHGLALINNTLFLMPFKNERYVIKDNKLMYQKGKKYIYLHYSSSRVFVKSIPI
jgi:hypothetical protein